MIDMTKIDELFDIMDLESSLADIVIPPQSGVTKDLWNRFLDSYLATTVKERIIKEVKILFSNMLSEEEIDGLLAFYKSNAGQALVKKLPIINREAIHIGSKVAKEMMSDEKLDEEFDMWKRIVENDSKEKILH